MTPAEMTLSNAVAQTRDKHHRMLFSGLPKSPGRRKDAVERERVRTVVDDILFECLKQKPRLAA